MDVITHAMMGAILASPMWPSAPLTACGFVIGSVLPDVDALSRCFGKRAFLRWHQTYTHGLPFILAAGLAAWLVIPEWAGAERWAAPLALSAGMLCHNALDVTNTYGTAVLSPLSSRRFCTEWVFFIDAVVVAACAAALLWLGWRVWATGETGFTVAGTFAAFVAAYWTTKAILRARAGRRSPVGTRALVPSALVPWRFFGCLERRRDGGGDASGLEIETFAISALTGRLSHRECRSVFDGSYADRLNELPEFRVMRRLSPAYHVTDVRNTPAGTQLTCRDLRTRNFGGEFGRLTVLLDSAGRIAKAELNV